VEYFKLIFQADQSTGSQRNQTAPLAFFWRKFSST